MEKTTINWRIYNLVKKGVLSRIGRGRYRLGHETKYIPEIRRREKILFNKLKAEFPFIEMCIWNTKIINEFMQHQAGIFQTILEIENEASEAVFYYLREINQPVFIKPNKDILEKYLPADKKSVIIKPLVSESPLQECCNLKTLTIEKLLVDLFIDKDIFAAQQGSELITIFEDAFSKYTINLSKLLRYADRRGKKENLIEFIKQST